MKKLIAVALSVILLCGCSSNLPEQNGNQDSKEVSRETIENGAKKYEISEDDCPIVFVMRRTNYAWGKQDNGAFIDICGDMYSFDFSERDIKNEEFVDALIEVRDNSSPVRSNVAPADKIAQIVCEDIPNIDTTAEVTSKHAMCDYGQDTLYAVSAKKSALIELRSEGDFTRELQDSTAKKLCSYYDRRILQTKAENALKDFFDDFFG